jgi:hypothetical protein
MAWEYTSFDKQDQVFGDADRFCQLRVRFDKKLKLVRGGLLLIQNLQKALIEAVLLKPIVGDENSYGKGTFQTFTLDAASNGRVNPKGEYKVTRGRYYTVSGKSPQLVGVSSDVVVPGPYSALEIGEKYTKYPLENDSIPENFQDDLSDIPPKQRDQISWLYRYNLQPKLKIYSRQSLPPKH